MSIARIPAYPCPRFICAHGTASPTEQAAGLIGVGAGDGDGDGDGVGGGAGTGAGAGAG